MSVGTNISQSVWKGSLLHMCEVILPTCVHGYSEGLNIQILVCTLVYFLALRKRTMKALASLRECAVSSETSLFAYALSASRLIIFWILRNNLGDYNFARITWKCTQRVLRTHYVWPFARQFLHWKYRKEKKNVTNRECACQWEVHFA